MHDALQPVDRSDMKPYKAHVEIWPPNVGIRVWILRPRIPSLLSVRLVTRLHDK